MATIKEIASAIKKMGLGGKHENTVKSIPKLADALGVELTGGFVGQVYEAEPVAYPDLVLKPTQAGVKAGREAGLRFERIAARIRAGGNDISVAEVRELAEKAGVGSDYYIDRGRRPNGGSGNSSKPKAKASSGRRTKKEEPKATSGRRGRGTQAEAKAEPKTRGRRGTRAAASPK